MVAAGSALKSAFTTVKDVALASYNDLRIGRDEAMDYERQRLVARAGTGNFDRFQDNLNLAMNQVNVQNRQQFTADLATAYSGYYSQAFGGGIQGEQKTAAAVGAMHTLGSVAGLAPEAVGGATNALYDPTTYYKAMAAGIQTRNPVTGDMLNPEEIINQYRGRLSGNTPEEIKRALGPGGMLRAELNQTYQDAGLVEMISKGIVMSAEAGKPMEVGDLQSMAIETGYAGGVWTQGKDSSTKLNQAYQERVAEYTNDVTNGIATSNNILADINAKMANLEGLPRTLVAMGETFGGLMDTFTLNMPQTTAVVEDQAKQAIASLVDAIKSGNPLDLLNAGVKFGSLALGGGVIKAWTGGEADKDPEKSGTYPSGGGTGTAPPGAGVPAPATPTPQQAQAAVMPQSSGTGTMQAAVMGWPSDEESAVRAAVMPQSLEASILGWPTGEEQPFTSPRTGGIAFIPEDGTSPEVSNPDADLRTAVELEKAEAEKRAAEAEVTDTNRQAPNVTINLSIANATGTEATRFAYQVKRILENDAELEAMGSGRMSTYA